MKDRYLTLNYFRQFSGGSFSYSLDYPAEAALAIGGGGEAGEAFEELSEVGLGLEAEFVAYFLDGEVSVGKSGHSGQQRILVDEVLA